MTLSIITPSFGQLDWLRLCVASVRDQVSQESRDDGPESSATPRLSTTLRVEHIIQDAGSPGIEEFAREVGADFYRDGALVFTSRHSPPATRGYTISIYSETDDGMYDAINRGLRKASGEICAYLNCDEQYLPETLRKVAAIFEARKSLCLLFGDAVLANETGPVAYRRMILPRREHLQKRPLNTLTCATFFRRELIDRGPLFDPQWKIIGDKAWVYTLIESGIVMATFPRPLAVYFFTGENLSESPNGMKERAAWMKQHPAHPYYPARLVHYLRKLLAGAYWTRSLTISIYTPASSAERVTMTNPQTGHNWPKPNAPKELQSS